MRKVSTYGFPEGLLRTSIQLLPLVLASSSRSLIAEAAVANSQVSEADRRLVLNTNAELPMSFEINQGQTDGRVKYFTRGSGYTLFLTSNEAVLDLRKPDQPGDERASHGSPTKAGFDDGTERGEKAAGESVQNAALRLRFEGDANPNCQLEGVTPLPGKSNYLMGKEPAGWRTGIPHYRKVRYTKLYPGIDLEFYGWQGRLEYDFVVTAGANPDDPAGIPGCRHA